MLRKTSIHSVSRPLESDFRSSLLQRRRTSVEKSVTSLLEEIYGLYQQCLYYYSTATSMDHIGLDELLEKQCDNLQSIGDKISERLAMIGHQTADRPAHLYLPSFPANRMAVTSVHGMLKNLIKGHEDCSRKALHALENAEEIGDQKTASILLQAVLLHEKSIWMIKALCT